MVAGADLRLSYFRYFDNRVALLDKSPPSSPARTALTSRPCFTHQPAHSPQRKEHFGGIEPHLHKPHFQDMLLTMPLPVMGSVSWSDDQVISLVPVETYFRPFSLCSVLAACDAVAAAPLMDWIMSPSSGQSIIWRDRKDSNLRPFG